MLVELLAALLVGLLAGTITGLLPGIHINLVSAFVISSLAFLLAHFPPIAIAVFIIAMSISHTFLDFIPSIFLGAPDDSALSVLPGHKMLLEGNGYQGAMCAVYGCIASLPFILACLPMFIFLLPQIFFYLNPVMLLVLVSASAFLLYKNEKKAAALFVFILAGILGVFSMNLAIQNSLLPLLSGLFGASSLLVSISQKQKMAPQKIEAPEIKKKDIFSAYLSSAISVPACSFLPALGSSQAAIISGSGEKNLEPKNFLLLLGIINLSVLALSFVTLYSIGKSRTGSAAAIADILENFNFSSLLIILTAILFASLFSFFIAKKTAKIFAKNIERLDYPRLSIFILIFLSLIVLLFSGALGFLLYLTSTLLGIYTILSNTRRTNLMGCLMLPSILLYLPF